MSLIVHTARNIEPLPADCLHVSIPANDACGDEKGHRGIGFAFTPTRQLREQYQQRVKAGTDTDRYWLNCCEFYVQRMRLSYRNNRQPWMTLLSWSHVVLIGEEPEASRCFSTVLVQEVLKKMGAKYMGELT